jgi:tRNA threonylcarbamoyladenosine biosynthesis protein TsaE
LGSSSATPAPRTFETDGPAQTEACAAELARLLQPGDVVLVSGELGAGKTTFVRGAARALGVTAPVTSPTFAIGNRYDGAGLGISHLDLYRLASLDAEEPELLADYVGFDRVAFVEWPAQAESRLEGVRARVKLEHRGGDRRRIEIVVEPAAGAG